MPESGSVRIDQHKGIARLEFSHPKANSLSAEMLDTLTKASSEAAADPKIKVISVESVGQSFCAGANFDEFKRLSTIEEATEFFGRFAALFLVLRSAPKWVVARVHGKAVGGGVGIVAVADYSIGCPATAVSLSEYALGIGPYVIGPVIERRIGVAAFASMALDCQWRDFHWCLERGLLDASADDERGLLSDHEELLHTLSLRSVAATAMLKKTAWQGFEHWDQLLYARAKISAELLIASRSLSGEDR